MVLILRGNPVSNSFIKKVGGPHLSVSLSLFYLSQSLTHSLSSPSRATAEAAAGRGECGSRGGEVAAATRQGGHKRRLSGKRRRHAGAVLPPAEGGGAALPLRRAARHGGGARRGGGGAADVQEGGHGRHH